MCFCLSVANTSIISKTFNELSVTSVAEGASGLRPLLREMVDIIGDIRKEQKMQIKALNGLYEMCSEKPNPPRISPSASLRGRTFDPTAFLDKFGWRSPHFLYGDIKTRF